MNRFALSAQASRDIKEIRRYIATDNVSAAREFRVRLLKACQRLADNPRMGHTRTDLTDQAVLFWPVGPCLIIYDADRMPLLIIRVVHGARDVAGLF